jgi:hypothetical protein
MPASTYTVKCTRDENILIDGYRRTQDRGRREEWSGGRLRSKKRRALSHSSTVQQINCGAFFASFFGNQRNLRFKKFTATLAALVKLVLSTIAHLSHD